MAARKKKRKPRYERIIVTVWHSSGAYMRTVEIPDCYFPFRGYRDDFCELVARRIYGAHNTRLRQREKARINHGRS
jgi:hypothetical protein